MNYRISYKIATPGCCLALLLLLLHSMYPNDWIGICGNVLLILSLLQALIFLRCPDCGRSLMIRGKRPDYCPGCGMRLEW